jgi:aldehyde dehydrogenase (NAD+)
LDEKTEVGPVINQAAMEKILGYIEIGQKEDKAKLACGGNRLTKGDFGKRLFYRADGFHRRNQKYAHRAGRDFRTRNVRHSFSTLEEAIDIVNDVKYGFSSAIYTKDVNQAFYAMQELYTGICYVNSATIGAEVHLPFGGTKGTGNGHREAGTQVLDIFTEWKSLYVDYSGKLQRAQIDLVEI